MARDYLLQVRLSSLELAALDQIAVKYQRGNQASNRSEAVRAAVRAQLKQMEATTNGKTKTATAT